MHRFDKKILQYRQLQTNKLNLNKKIQLDIHDEAKLSFIKFTILSYISFRFEEYVEFVRPENMSDIQKRKL